MTASGQFRRILLKLSGEALSGARASVEGFGIDTAVLNSVCEEIASVVRAQVQVAVVIGGGNFFRGVRASESGIERATADYIGMLATVMNALAIQQGLKQIGVQSRVQSAIPISPVSEPYVRLRALKHLNRGRVVIFASGTGNPYFTTDTAASLRAAEINADVLIKATKVDGVYDKDPSGCDEAQRYQRITFDEVLQKRLQVMDATAIALCRDNCMPLRVLSIKKPGELLRMIEGKEVGTLITGAEPLQ